MTGVPLPIKGRCPDIVDSQGLCRQGPKNGWCEWGHGPTQGGGGKGRTGDFNARAVALAKAVCEQCPVLEQCRSWALQEPDPTPFMVTGGLTTRERKAVRNPPPPIRHGWEGGYRQHVRRGEDVCDACRHAYNDAARDRAARFRETA